MSGERGPVRDEPARDLHSLERRRKRFVNWYNHEHHHTGLGLHTPADVHHGLAAKADQRATTLTAARATHPRTLRHPDPTEDARPPPGGLDQPTRQDRTAPAA